jgi:hypothetical protein
LADRARKAKQCLDYDVSVAGLGSRHRSPFRLAIEKGCLHRLAGQEFQCHQIKDNPLNGTTRQVIHSVHVLANTVLLAKLTKYAAAN